MRRYGGSCEAVGLQFRRQLLAMHVSQRRPLKPANPARRQCGVVVAARGRIAHVTLG